MKLPRCFLALAVGLIALFPALAGTTGRLVGFVKDSAGMPVTGAKVTLEDKTKGKNVTVSSDRKGSYVFPVVFPGTYNLHAEADGFVPENHPLVMHVDSVLRVDLLLSPDKGPH